jgi:hypothetical protein
MKKQIKLRFNTEKEKADQSLPAWRVLIDGVEHLATGVRIEAPIWTSEDILPTGQRKWHISSEGTVHWNEDGSCLIQ